MKVLLIRPFNYYGEFLKGGGIPEPLGLEYIASYIREEHDVRIFDCFAEGWDVWKHIGNGVYHFGSTERDIERAVKKFKPDVVGISAQFTPQMMCSHIVANIIKSIDEDIINVIGGCHPSAVPEKVLNENKNIDIIVVGEGEITFKEILENENLEKIDGIVYRKGNNIKRNKPRKVIENLDEIPFPARDLIPFENFNKMFGNPKDSKLFHIIHKIIVNTPFASQYYDFVYEQRKKMFGSNTRVPAASIITSRGCPSRCYFCCIHSVWGYSYRMRSVNNVLDELTILHNEYKIKHINIEDDNFNFSKKRIIEICKGIKERGLDFTFRASSGTYVPSVDEEVIKQLKSVGFSDLYLGIESGNQRILDNVVKKLNLNLNKVKEVIGLCKKHRIRTGGYFVLGMPGETLKDMQDTINFAVSSGLDMVRLYICQPFPGSDLERYCKTNKLFSKELTDRQQQIFGDKCYINTEEFSSNDVEKIVREGREILIKEGKLTHNIGKFTTMKLLKSLLKVNERRN